MQKISGYELVKSILSSSNNNLKTLLKCADDRENEWLEFKAGVHLLPDENSKETDEDLLWNITKAVIAIMNTVGGAVIIGIRDNDLEVVPLETCDPRNVIKQFGVDRYFREQILNKICPVKNKWKTSKGDIYTLRETGYCLSDYLEIKSVSYQGHDIALILIKPVGKGQKCIKVLKNNREEIVFARKKGVGESQEIRFSDEISNYENSREIEDEGYSSILQKASQCSSERNVHPFYNEWRMMIQQLEGMESLLQSNEHDALQNFCGIVEKAICDLAHFCIGQQRDMKLAESEIHQVWAQLKDSGNLERKLNIAEGLRYPDLGEIENLKELDRNESSRLKNRLSRLFYDWMNFAEELADSFPEEARDELTSAHNNLPRNFEDIEFIGRKEELDELLRFLSHRENRNYFLTITGEGGMGKSTLALAAAYAVLKRDPKTSGVAKEDLTYQNIIWASAKERDFQEHEFTLDPDIENHVGLLDTILNVLDPGHSLGDLNAKQNKVRQILQGTRSLLIIDNMETINDERLFHYLKNCIPAPTKIIGTDRNRAKTERAIQLPPMNRDESKSMINSLVKGKAQNFTQQDYDRFYELSYGIPKVIEWGCRRLNTHEAEIEDVFRYLSEAKRGSKNQIYEYLFGSSYNQLSVNAKTILNTLALFDFPIQCKMIGLLTEMDRGIDEYIDELSSYTLISINGSGSERTLFEKYASVQDYIKNYAVRKSASNANFDKYKVYARAKKVFLEEIKRVCGISGWPHLEAYSWGKTNISMIKWLSRQLLDSGNSISNMHDFILAIVPVLSNIGLPDDIDFFCRRAIAVILNIPDTDNATMEFDVFIDLMLSSFRKTMGEEVKSIAADIMQHWAWNMFRQARNNFKEVSEILCTLHEAAAEIKTPSINILVLRTLGLIDKEQNRLDEAEAKLLRVVEMCKQQGNLLIEAITLGSLGSIYRDKNDLKQACSYMERAFTILEQIEDQSSLKEVLSVFYQKYAKLKIKSGEIDDAMDYINKAQEIDKLIGRQYGFAHNKQLMAIINEQKKNYSQAFRDIREARDIFVRLNSGKEIEADYERIKKMYDNQQFT